MSGLVENEAKETMHEWDGQSFVELPIDKRIKELKAQRDELLEENQEWASLIGQVYVMLQQDDAKGALKLIREENIITFKDGSPVASSCVGVLAYKAEGGE